MANNNKKLPPHLLLVLLAIGAAAVSVGILHKMRERRVLAVLLQERDQQLMSFQVLFEVWISCSRKKKVCMRDNSLPNRLLLVFAD